MKRRGFHIAKLSFFLCILLSVFLFQVARPASADEPSGVKPLTETGLRLRNLSAEGRRGGVVLVLSGGGTKGFAHLGVLKVLEEENIPVVGIVGTSIGSVIGGMYATGYSADEIRKIVMETNIMGLLADSGTRLKPDAGDHRPLGENVKFYQKNLTKDLKAAGPLGVLPAVSLVNFLTKYTGHIQTTDFNYLPIPFACVATDLSNGDTIVLRDGNLASAIRASVAIPGLLEPWPLDGRLLVDGGLVANLPVEIAKDIFPGYPIIAVNLSGTTIAKSTDRFTSMVDVLLQTIDIMTIDRLEKNEALADLVLFPDTSGFSMLDATGYDVIFERGLAVAEAHRKEMVDISLRAPSAPSDREREPADRIVRSVRVEGLHPSAAADIEKTYAGWVGHTYDINKVNEAIERISKRDEIATVDIDTYPVTGGARNDVEVVFSVEKRAPYELALNGYTSNLHSHRWLSLMLNARDLASDGDSAYFEGRLGDGEWGAMLRYFTPVLNHGQWGFALNARREELAPHGLEQYRLERYSARAVYYLDHMNERFGIGVAGEHTNAQERDGYVWGPYLYFNMDTLDNLLTPTRGYSLNSQIWWNSDSILVSQSNLTAYVPLKSDMHIVLNFGLETGDKEHQAYRAILGDQEELFSLARHPYIGDQAAWARVGVGYNFYTSWWGSLRGELFAAYGMIMDDWSRTDDAWETGLAFSVPGQFLNGKVLLIYDDGGEFTVGFTLGIPRWWSGPLP